MSDPAPTETNVVADTPTSISGGEVQDAPSSQPAATKDAPADSKPIDAVAPVKYDIKGPDGYDTEELIKFAQDNKLDPKIAQQLIDREVQSVLSVMEQAREDHKEQASKWVESLKKDKDFGGDNFSGNAKKVAAFVKQHADPETIAFFNETGFGNHPGIVKMFHKLASNLGSDSLSNPNAGPASVGELPLSRRLYPNMPVNNQ